MFMVISCVSYGLSFLCFWWRKSQKKFTDGSLVIKLFVIYLTFGLIFAKFNYSKHVHYTDVIMGTIASQITSLTIVYSTVYSDADQRKHKSSASLAFVRGIHRGPVNSTHKWPVTRKMFQYDDVIMCNSLWMCLHFMRYSCRIQSHYCMIITTIG